MPFTGWERLASIHPAGFMRDPANGLRIIYLPRNPVNRPCALLRSLPLDGVYNLLSLWRVLVELGGPDGEDGYHRLAPHVLQDDQAGPVFPPECEGRGTAAEPEEGHAARAAPLAVVAFRQVPHDQVEPHAFDPPHLDRIVLPDLQVRVPPEPADHVLRDVRLVRGVGPGGLEEPRPL